MMLSFEDVSAQSHTNPRTALPINLNQNYTRFLTRDNYRNNFYTEISVPKNGFITYSVSRPTDSAGVEVDFYIEIHNLQGVKVMDINTSSYNPVKEEFIYSIGLEKGTYYINTKIRGSVVSGSIPYDYKVAFTATDFAEKEPNQGISTATEVSVGKAYRGFYNDREDYYRVNSETTRVVSFLVDRSTYEDFENQGYTYITIIDASGKEKNLWIGSSLSYWKITEDGEYFSTDFTLGKGNNYIVFPQGEDKENGYTFMIQNNKTGWVQESGNWYFYDNSSILQKGWLNQTGKWYYLDEWTGVMQTGWSKAGTYDDWYFMNGSGVMQTGWQKLGNSWYFMNSSGSMKTGWHSQAGKWYLLDRDSGVMQTGWSRLNQWGDWYYMNGSGVMQTGWQKIGNLWYFMDSTGVMQSNFLQQGRNKYYLSTSSGAMQIGWFKNYNSWHYSNSSGLVQTGWLRQNGHWYYLNPSWDGEMQTGWTYIDGKEYTFDSSGRLQ